MTHDDLAQMELQKDELRQRLHGLKGDLQRTQEAIDRAETSLQYLEGYTAAVQKILADSEVLTRDIERTRRAESASKRIKNPDREQVVDAALAMIAEAGQPLSRQTLFDGLEAKGVAIQGKNPLMVFSTMLWRTQDRIVRLRGHGYWPTYKPYPPAQYSPAVEQPALF